MPTPFIPEYIAHSVLENEEVLDLLRTVSSSREDRHVLVRTIIHVAAPLLLDANTPRSR